MQSSESMNETKVLLDVFTQGHKREHNFYRNLSIIIALLFVLNCTIIYLINFKLIGIESSSLTGYSILGLAILVVGFGFSMKIYFREKRWLKAISIFEKERIGGVK